MFFQSFTNDTGAFVGLHNFIAYFADEETRPSIINTLILGIATTIITVALAFPYAYAVTCTRMPLRRLFLVLSMLPL